MRSRVPSQTRWSNPRTEKCSAQRNNQRKQHHDGDREGQRHSSRPLCAVSFLTISSILPGCLKHKNIMGRSSPSGPTGRIAPKLYPQRTPIRGRICRCCRYYQCWASLAVAAPTHRRMKRSCRSAACAASNNAATVLTQCQRAAPEGSDHKLNRCPLTAQQHIC